MSTAGPLLAAWSAVLRVGPPQVSLDGRRAWIVAASDAGELAASPFAYSFERDDLVRELEALGAACEAVLMGGDLAIWHRGI